MTTRYWTQNSVYEVNHAEKQVRRLEGIANPTPRIGEDGVWRTYLEINRRDGLLIRWADDAPGFAEFTWTSPIVREETVDDGV